MLSELHKVKSTRHTNISKHFCWLRFEYTYNLLSLRNWLVCLLVFVIGLALHLTHIYWSFITFTTLVNSVPGTIVEQNLDLCHYSSICRVGKLDIPQENIMLGNSMWCPTVHDILTHSLNTECYLFDHKTSPDGFLVVARVQLISTSSVFTIMAW